MRQLIAEKNPDDAGRIFIDGKKFRYMKTVLRAKVGDMILVRLPGGKIQQTTVAKIDAARKKITLQVAGEFSAEKNLQNIPDAEFRAEIFLFQFVPKISKMDLIIRQATECGVAKIIPVEGEFCQKGNVDSARKKSAENDERWARIVTEAREQSGSPVDTKILPCMNLQDALKFWQKEPAEKKISVVLYERSGGAKKIQEAFKNADVKKDGKIKVAVAVGAEGGISSEEIFAMEKDGFVSVHFETNILRCETAALYGIASIQTIFGGV
jgi:16S rRNA (uracil1498-N3)-methyltransferase